MGMASTGLLTIDLAALAANWMLVSNRVNPQGQNVECGAVVKADAYGLGVIPVAKKLYEVGCRRFFVSTLDEAVELREQLGEELYIAVFGGLAHGLSDEWFSKQLTPVLFDINHIQQWVSYCHNLQKKLPCILKVDTGMHRLGIQPNQMIDFLSSDALAKQLNPEILMSHLACADDNQHALNALQLKEFDAISKAVKKVYPSIKLSLSNSAGSFLGKDFHFDVCRPGAALYGVNPTCRAVLSVWEKM